MQSEADGRTLGVARFSAIGDVAMAVPAVYSLCRTYPSLRVVFVTRPRLTQIFVNAPGNLTLVGADVDGEYAGAMGLRRLASRLVDEYGVTDYVDIHNVLRTRMLGLWLRVRGARVTTLIKGRAGRRALTRAGNKVFEPLMTSAERYAEALERAGFAFLDTFGGLFGGEAPEAMFAALSGPRPGGERWIGIAPFAAHAGKVYPADLMERVVDELAGIDSLRIFLFGGGAAEQAVLESWQARHPGKVVSVAGKKAGFAAEMALMSRFDVMLTMDSANMHLAAIAGTRVLSVWGATHAYAGFAAWHTGAEDRIESALPCRPCSVFGNKPCARGDMMCMRSIKPSDVARRVLGALKPIK